MNPSDIKIPIELQVSFPPDSAAPVQFSVALGQLQQWFKANGLTSSECVTVMECHVKLLERSLP